MLCKRKEVNIIEAEICLDYVHMLVKIPPKMSVSEFVGYLKGKSTLIIFERYANLKYGNRHFWCRRYYVDKVSNRNEKNRRVYIKSVTKRFRIDQISLKEYIDPFMGKTVNKKIRKGKSERFSK